MISWAPPAIAFQSDIFTLTWYGIILSGAVLASYSVIILLARLHDRGHGMKIGCHVDALFWWSFVPAFLGARILFILYHLSYFQSFPVEMFAVWHGGLVWHGALIGGIIGSTLYCAWKKIPWLAVADIATPALALGQAIGRWGNYFNQENYGMPTRLPWSISIEPQNRVSGFEQFNSFHPTFLYESLWDIGLFILCLLIMRQISQRTSSAHYIQGGLFATYLIIYSIGRFAIEFLRIDIVPVLWGLRIPQWWSVDLIVVGCILLWYVNRANNTPLRKH